LLEDQSVRVNVADEELDDAYIEDDKQARALHERRLHPARG
jgi:hypothetical protein